LHGWDRGSPAGGPQNPYKPALALRPRWRSPGVDCHHARQLPADCPKGRDLASPQCVGAGCGFIHVRSRLPCLKLAWPLALIGCVPPEGAEGWAISYRIHHPPGDSLDETETYAMAGAPRLHILLHFCTSAEAALTSHRENRPAVWMQADGSRPLSPHGRCSRPVLASRVDPSPPSTMTQGPPKRCPAYERLCISDPSAKIAALASTPNFFLNTTITPCSAALLSRLFIFSPSHLSTSAGTDYVSTLARRLL